MLILKKEQHAISFKENIQLFIHLLICDFCSIFKKQSKLINEKMTDIHTQHPVNVTETFKQKILSSITE